MTPRRAITPEDVFKPLRAIDPLTANLATEALTKSYSKAICHVIFGITGVGMHIPPERILHLQDARRAVLRNLFDYASQQGRDDLQEFFRDIAHHQMPVGFVGPAHELEQLLIGMGSDVPGRMRRTFVNALLRQALDHRFENLIAWIIERGVKATLDFRYDGPPGDAPTAWHRTTIESLPRMIDARKLEKAFAAKRPDRSIATVGAGL